MLCRVCQQDKPETMFEMVGKSRRKLCMDCRKDQQKAYREANKTELYAKQAKWREANREKARLYAETYRAENPELAAEARKKSALKHKDKYNAVRRSRTKEDPEYVEKRRAGAKASHQKYREQRILDMRDYAKRNPHIFHAKSVKRRARMSYGFTALANELTALVVQEACALRDARAAATGIPWEIDHIVPLNGKTVSGFHIFSNIAVIPLTANRAKRNHFDDERAQYAPRAW